MTISKEIAFGIFDIADEKTAVRIGLLTGADTIFTVSYTMFGGKVRVISKLFNV